MFKENKDAAKRYEKIKQERQKYLDHPSVKDYKKKTRRNFKKT